MALIINGERVEDSVVQQEVERMRPHYEHVFAEMDPKERQKQLLEWSKENVIERALVRQDAQKNGGDIPEAEIESALAEFKEQNGDEADAEQDSKLRQDVELQLKIDKRLGAISRNVSKPSEEDIAKYYEQYKEQFRSPEQIRVAHIVKYIDWQTDEATAYKAVNKAGAEMDNGTAFELVVDKYTDCGDSGGDLGYVMRGQMVEEFEDVVFNLNVGEVSGIFRTRFGFHIAKAYDRKPAEQYSLEDVRQRIAGTLKEQSREEAVEKFVDKLKSGAKIEQV